jgi:hypothetical protein
MKTNAPVQFPWPLPRLASKWAGIQIYYPVGQEAVQKATGVDLAESMLAVFRGLTPIMNLSMQVKLAE